MMNRLLMTTATASCSKATAASSFRLSNNTSLPSLSFVLSSSARYFSDISSTTDPSSAVSDDDIKVGTVKYFGMREGYGFITPSWIDEKNATDDDMVFIHRSDIKRIEVEGSDFRYSPNLQRGERVQFKLLPKDEGKPGLGKASEVTLEGGELVPPFVPGYLEKYIRTAKARFGDTVYDIFSTSQDQKELELKIVAAYDKVKEDIDRQTAKVTHAMEMAAKGCKQ